MDFLVTPALVFPTWLIFALIVLLFDQRIKRKMWALRGGKTLRVFKRRYSSYREFNHRFNIMFYFDLFSKSQMKYVKNPEQRILLKKLRITTLIFVFGFISMLTVSDILGVIGS
jgi:hypothetical protein